MGMLLIVIFLNNTKIDFMEQVFDICPVHVLFKFCQSRVLKYEAYTRVMI